MKNRFFSISLMILLIAGCDSTTQNPVGEITFLPKTMAIVEADNQLGFELFDQLYTDIPENGNIFISPVSINLALAMARNGANNATLDSIEQVMHLAGMTSQEINETFQSLINDLSNLDNQVILNIANSIWYDVNLQVESPFIQTNQQFYNAEVTALDFADPYSVGIINNWVAEKTNDKIKTIISNLSPYDRMVLINAIYFKGNWKYQFDENETYDGQFLLEDNSPSDCKFMKIKLDAEIMNNEVVRAIKLPYGNESYEMVVLMPHDAMSIQDLVDQLTAENWSQWNNAFTLETEVNLHLPRFTFEYEKTLNEALINLGMGIAFGDQADFSGISQTEFLYISEVIHKSFVEVNEKGTEAAAVTAIVFETTSMPTEKYFIANKAFVFLIQEKQTGAIMFMGKVGKP